MNFILLILISYSFIIIINLSYSLVIFYHRLRAERLYFPRCLYLFVPSHIPIMHFYLKSRGFITLFLAIFSPLKVAELGYSFIFIYLNVYNYILYSDLYVYLPAVLPLVLISYCIKCKSLLKLLVYV